jgi:hypothetical protein
MGLTNDLGKHCFVFLSLFTEQRDAPHGLLGTLSRVLLQGSAVFEIRSQLKREDPLNLSILVRGGKETNKDSPSNGE